MQFSFKNNSHHTYSFKAFIKELLLSFVLIVSIAFYPSTARAGMFGFTKSVAPSEASAHVDLLTQQNSQTVPVLTAPTSSTLGVTANSSDDVVLTSGNVLSAEIGPAGTVSQVDEAKNAQISVYTVRNGDTLSQIATLFNVSVNTIVWANDLDRSVALKTGQSLVILPMSGIKYVIKKGDTIQGVVARYKADLSDVLLYNDININSKLSVGDTILIPDVELGATAIKPVVVTKSTTKTTSGILPRSKWGGPNPLRDSDYPCYPGYYIRPIVGGVETQGLHGHNAVDLSTGIVGTPIHAAADGTVIISKMGGWNGGYGNYVVITHPNGTQTLYAHASKTLVSVGDDVRQGQTIALMGATGEATGPHVHFEIWKACNPF